MSEEWGLWIKHDGKHIPPHGAFCQATFNDCETLSGIVDHLDETHVNSFLWLLPEELVAHVVLYRIRKPRGMTILEGLLKNLPATVEGVDA